MSIGMYQIRNLNRFAENSAVVYRPTIDVMKLSPINQGMAQEYVAYLSPFGRRERIVLPKKMNGSASVRQNTKFAIKDFIMSGRESPPLAAISAVNGKMVKAMVARRKVAISENLVAI